MAPTAEEWIAQFAEALGQAAPTDAQMAEVLALASVAAHSSERRAAPIACWLAALAGRDPEDARLAEPQRRLASARASAAGSVIPVSSRGPPRPRRPQLGEHDPDRGLALQAGAQHGERAGLVAGGERLAARGGDAAGRGEPRDQVGGDERHVAGQRDDRPAGPLERGDQPGERMRRLLGLVPDGDVERRELRSPAWPRRPPPAPPPRRRPAATR